MSATSAAILDHLADTDACAICGGEADLYDDAAVPYCARDWDRLRAWEMELAERECGWRTDRDAASDRECK